jgi:hypothetical protein
MRLGMPNREWWRSVVRHTVIPLISGGIVAGWETYSAGGVSPKVAIMAGSTALISGLMRLLQGWAKVVEGTAPAASGRSSKAKE